MAATARTLAEQSRSQQVVVADPEAMMRFKRSVPGIDFSANSLAAGERTSTLRGDSLAEE